MACRSPPLSPRPKTAQSLDPLSEVVVQSDEEANPTYPPRLLTPYANIRLSYHCRTALPVRGVLGTERGLPRRQTRPP